MRDQPSCWAVPISPQKVCQSNIVENQKESISDFGSLSTSVDGVYYFVFKDSCRGGETSRSNPGKGL